MLLKALSVHLYILSAIYIDYEKSKIAQIPCNLQYDRAVGYFYLGRKTIKNVSTILRKLATKTILQFGSILDPTWLILGGFWVPSWSQVSTKIEKNGVSKRCPKNYEKQVTQDMQDHARSRGITREFGLSPLLNYRIVIQA